MSGSVRRSVLGCCARILRPTAPHQVYIGDHHRGDNAMVVAMVVTMVILMVFLMVIFEVFLILIFSLVVVKMVMVWSW